jgi:hypothetical protein
MTYGRGIFSSFLAVCEFNGMLKVSDRLKANHWMAKFNFLGVKCVQVLPLQNDLEHSPCSQRLDAPK